MNEMKPDTTVVDSLLNLPFLSDSLTISNLETELPSYLAKAMDISANFDILEWWRRHSDTLPHWSLAAKKILVVQPSSASAERAFSILANSFGDRQENSLEDYICRSISRDSVQPALTLSLSLFIFPSLSVTMSFVIKF